MKTKRTLLMLACVLISVNCAFAQKSKKAQTKTYDVAAFHYPAYVRDEPRLLPFFPSGMGEWETVMTMQKRNPGHYWNRQPLWGYINEADPAVMAMEIDQATKHGVNVFIFDWYWYDERPFLETTLDNGFLKAENVDKMKFYLMWANHDGTNIWDTRINTLDTQNVIWKGSVSRQAFEAMCKRNIEKYFKHPQYYKIDGKPVFMIYDTPKLIEGFGGVEQTVAALKWFRDEVKKAGFPDLDLQFTMWQANFNSSGVDSSRSGSANPQNDFVNKLGYNSATHYQFAHFVDVNRDYMDILPDVKREWERVDSQFDMVYYPHISVGWDNSPRVKHSAVVKNNTPENFRKGLEMAKEFADSHPGQAPLITINSWNEWTETSYLMPCSVYGYGYLEAIKAVFVDNQAPADKQKK